MRREKVGLDFVTFIDPEGTLAITDYLKSAASVVVAHNHPSGDSSPSQEDLNITEKLYQTGKIIGIELLDHVIIGEDGFFYSLKERGHIK
jgi:DNA repair protein RadC